MDKVTNASVAAAVCEMADNMTITWDGQLNWAVTTKALIGLITDVLPFVSPDHLAVLMSAAAMAQRQSMRLAEDSEVAS